MAERGGSSLLESLFANAGFRGNTPKQKMPIKNRKMHTLNSSNDIYLAISKSTHHPTNKKPIYIGQIVLHTRITHVTLFKGYLYTTTPYTSPKMINNDKSP